MSRSMMMGTSRRSVALVHRLIDDAVSADSRIIISSVMDRCRSLHWGTITARADCCTSNVSVADPNDGVRGMSTHANKEETANSAGEDEEKQLRQSKQWWMPDPETGDWVPEGTRGIKIPARQSHIRTQTTAVEDKRWWTSMEELPDMDRGNK